MIKKSIQKVVESIQKVAESIQKVAESIQKVADVENLFNKIKGKLMFFLV